ncbi:hypothetical protein DM2_334 [Halorubrum sp. DM2]|nr:hypothetical protein DM2_334 [Halorubrum sp. DM2]
MHARGSPRRPLKRDASDRSGAASRVDGPPDQLIKPPNTRTREPTGARPSDETPME